MTLLIQDRCDREPDQKVTDTVKIAEHTRRLALLLNRRVEDVREDLVCGNTLRTLGYYYTLLD